MAGTFANIFFLLQLCALCSFPIVDGFSSSVSYRYSNVKRSINQIRPSSRFSSIPRTAAFSGEESRHGEGSFKQLAPLQASSISIDGFEKAEDGEKVVGGVFPLSSYFSRVRNWLAKVNAAIPQPVKHALKVVVPLAVALILVFSFGNVASAAEKAAKSAKKAVGTQATIVQKKKTPAIFKIIKRLLEGANAKGSTKSWKAGDTRSEFAALLNAASGLFILSGFGVVAYIGHTVRDMKYSSNLKKEIVKVQQYKEDMYIETVQEVLKKLADPKLKGSTKANLTKQLKELDPDGQIAAFIEGKGPRPDLSDRVGKKSSKNGDSPKRPKNKAIKSKKDEDDDKDSDKKPKGKNTEGSKDDDDEEEDADNEEEQEEDNDDERMSRKLKPAPSSAQRSLGKSPTGAKRPPSRGLAPSPGKKDSGSGGKANNSDGKVSKGQSDEVFRELYDSLDGVLPDKTRRKLVDYIQGRVEKISDPAKREAATAKIAQRLGDDQYWIDYAEKNI